VPQLGRAREAVRLRQADEVFKPFDFHGALSPGGRRRKNILERKIEPEYHSQQDRFGTTF
jgi:hypothetical protein